MECPYCHLPFKSITGCQKHIRSVHPKQPYFLCDCGQVFEFKRGLSFHQKKCQQLTVNICNPEPKKYHNAELPYKCPLCDRRFKSESNWRYHVEVEHPLKLMKEI